MLILEFTYSDMCHIETALKVLLGNYEAVTAFGCKDFDEKMAELRHLAVQVGTCLDFEEING